MKINAFKLLPAAMLLGLSLGLTACSDDDEKSEQRNEDANFLDTDEAQVAWRWLCALTDAQTLPSNWASKSYEPTVGVASENDANTRIVVVADMDEAKAKFADLADVETTKLGSEYTINQSGVGRMTWTPSKQGAQNLAEVSVDTKLIPHLQKIVYCTSDQVGANGLFWDNVVGTAYYRFGDVIRNRTTGQYWVCVRPAFQQGDKGDSHWISIFNAKAGNNIPEDNLQTDWNGIEKYNNKTIILPTGMKYKREHLNNLTNLIFALLDPDAYAKKVDPNGTKNGLGGFDYQYHGKNFLDNVAFFWDDPIAQKNLPEQQTKTVWELLFNCTHQQMSDNLKNIILIYQGYQWRVGTTGYVWEYKASRQTGFQRSAPGSESGDKVLYNFGTEGYDVTRYAGSSQADNTAGGPQQFENNGDYRWVVAYAKGENLMKNGKYSPYEQINGFEDIYNYNQKTGNGAHNPLETDTTMVFNGGQRITPKVGDFIGSDGRFYSKLADVTKAGVQPVAVVTFYNTGNYLIEHRKDPYDFTEYHGLAMALDDIDEKEWALKAGYNDGLVETCANILTSFEFSAGEEERMGIYWTKWQAASQCQASHVHPAAKACYDKTEISPMRRKLQGLSNWFLPSMGQWLTAIGQWAPFYNGEFDEVRNGENYRKMKISFKEWGIDDKTPSGTYWINTHLNDSLAYQIVIADDQPMHLLPMQLPGIDNEDDPEEVYRYKLDSTRVANINKGCLKYEKRKVRPFIAIK